MKRTFATSLTALAIIGAGIATGAPATAGDNYGTAVPAYAPTAGPAKSWGPLRTAAELKKGNAACESTGTAGVKAKKWRSFTCEITKGGKAGDYVGLWVKI
ncbi:hypothetical protein [Streptomyces sp. NPDC059134]|uniref:hypothetical protein n=1 Tax=Streptomyces sp. NPDC059134 TaxID=3346738 RepID=UPI0036843A71